MNQKLLCVEDSSDDILLLKLAFDKVGATVKLDFATDADKAIAALDTGYTGRAPACVLLDIKLPGKSGLEVLGWIRSEPRFKLMPVVMLTSSTQPSDITRAYELGANAYLVKPAELGTLIELVRTIDTYWVRTNTPAEVNA
jgi:CheY-like chemotaxis protein